MFHLKYFPYFQYSHHYPSTMLPNLTCSLVLHFLSFSLRSLSSLWLILRFILLFSASLRLKNWFYNHHGPSVLIRESVVKNSVSYFSFNSFKSEISNTSAFVVSIPWCVAILFSPLSFHPFASVLLSRKIFASLEIFRLCPIPSFSFIRAHPWIRG